MKSKTILGADGATKMRQITVGIHGKGGEAGISNGNIPERRGNHRGDLWRQPADAGRPD